MSDELKERNISKVILIVRLACATLDVGHPISWFTDGNMVPLFENSSLLGRGQGEEN
jgi:hypothetical protein